MRFLKRYFSLAKRAEHQLCTGMFILHHYVCENDCTHHWCLSERPFQSGSVRTIRSMSFFHSIPSEMTLCHSLHTSSAEHRERASRKDKMFSAIWSKPWAEKGKRKTNSERCFKTVSKISSGWVLFAVALINIFLPGNAVMKSLCSMGLR